MNISANVSDGSRLSGATVVEMEGGLGRIKTSRVPSTGSPYISRVRYVLILRLKDGAYQSSGAFHGIKRGQVALDRDENL